jgi:hypothetical protein
VRLLVPAHELEPDGGLHRRAAASAAPDALPAGARRRRGACSRHAPQRGLDSSLASTIPQATASPCSQAPWPSRLSRWHARQAWPKLQDLPQARLRASSCATTSALIFAGSGAPRGPPPSRLARQPAPAGAARSSRGRWHPRSARTSPPPPGRAAILARRPGPLARACPGRLTTRSGWWNSPIVFLPSGWLMASPAHRAGPPGPAASSAPARRSSARA